MNGRLPLAVVMLTAGFSPVIEGGTTHLPALILKLLVLSLLAVYVRSSLSDAAFRLPKTPLDKAVLLFLAATVFSLIIAPYKSMSMTWVQLIVFYSLFYYLACLAVSEKEISYAAWFVLVMGALEAVWGAYQYATGYQVIKGSFFNPNMLAGYVSISAVMAVSLAVFRYSRLKRPAITAALFGFALSCAVVVILSGSRGGILALAAGMFVVMWHRSRASAVIVVVSLITLLLVVPNPVKDKLLTGDNLNYSRLQIWSSTLERISDHPMGLGLGNYKYYSDYYRFPVDEVIRYGKTARTAHNEYLHFGSEMGILGTASILLGLYLTAGMLAGAVRKNKNGVNEAVAVGVAGGVTSVLAHSLVDSNMHEPGTVFMLLFLLSMGVRLGYGRNGGFREYKLTNREVWRAVALSVILLALAAIWAVKPELAWYHNENGIEALKEGRMHEALENTSRAVSIEPGNAAYHEQKASVLYTKAAREQGQGRLDEVLAELDQAESLNPINFRYPLLKAGIKKNLAESTTDPVERRVILEGVRLDLLRAAEVAPYEADVLYKLAATSLDGGMVDDAVAVLERLRVYEPSFFKGRLLLAQVYGMTGRRELSTKEAYSIIQDHEMLAGRISGPREKEFTGVDMDAVRALAQHTGTFE